MKSFKSILLLFVFSLAFLGCKKDAVKYSCNEEVHKWTVENLKSLEGLSRAELAALPFAYQRAALRSFSPEKKSEIWNEKLDIVLTQQWDDDELLLIQEMKSNLKPNLFTHSNILQTQVYFDDWSDRMFNETNMDTLTFVQSFFYIGTLEEIELLRYPPDKGEVSENLGENGQRVPDPPGSVWSEDCDCAWDTSCYFISMGTCDNENCNATDSGCKLFGMYKCEHRCTGEDPNQ